MPNPEYYYGAVKQAGEVITTKYSDCFTLEPDADSENHVWERRPLLCVPIPGLSAWTVPATLATASQASVTGSPAGAVHGMTGVSNGDGGAPSQQAAAKAKRERAEGGAGEVDAQDTPMSDQDVSVTVTEGHAPGTDVLNGVPGSMPAQPSAKRTHVHEHTHTAACGTSGSCSVAAGDGTHRLTGGCLVYVSQA